MPLRVNRRLNTFIKQGGIVAYATESCFGLGCDPSNSNALKKLLKLKQRDAAKGMIVIGAHIRQLQPFCDTLSSRQQTALVASWPAAHTWVVKANLNCNPLLTGGKNTLAIRVPDHSGARSLCAQAGMALVSTSANLSGQKSIKSYRAALRKFAGRAWVMQGKIGHYRSPSTIQDLATGKVLRK